MMFRRGGYRGKGAAVPPISRHLASSFPQYPFRCFDPTIIHDEPSSSKCPRLSKSQQDSKGLRSERERHDEAAHPRQEPRTKRYLKPTRANRFRTFSIL